MKLFVTKSNQFFLIRDVSGWITHGTNQHVVTAAGKEYLLNSGEFEKFKDEWFADKR